jgi:hypothetical protein
MPTVTVGPFVFVLRFRAPLQQNIFFFILLSIALKLSSAKLKALFSFGVLTDQIIICLSIVSKTFLWLKNHQLFFTLSLYIFLNNNFCTEIIPIELKIRSDFFNQTF